ncbi:MAG: response regulator [Blautia sp.]|nr:response regulator [Blautia sp.]
MIRILVADDEKVTRHGIITMLQRGLREEIECLEAGNGQEALEIVQSQLIHLIITDICMPLCSGLEFVEKLRQKDSEMTVVVVSGFENFEYAKQAVRLGVKDYITKPIQKDEFLGLIESCIADIQKRQMDVRTEYEKALKQDRISSEVRKERLMALLEGKEIEKSLERLRDLDVSFPSPFFFTAVIEYEVNDGVEECIDFVVEDMLETYLQRKGRKDFFLLSPKKGQTALLFGIQELAQRKLACMLFPDIASMLRQQIHAKVIVGIGKIVYDIRKISESFRRACLAADMKIFNSGRTVIRYEELASDQQKQPAHVSFRKLDEGSLPEILNGFSEIFRKKQDKAALLELQSRYADFCAAFDEKLRHRGWENLLPRHAFEDFWSEYELRHDVKEMVQYLAVNEHQRTRQEDQNALVSEMTEFIQEHVTEEIDLNYVAEHFGKTPGYIGTLFRRSKQMGFNEYVTLQRMDLARWMLRDTRISIQEVSERCGYYNTKYFSVVFKKTFGISPKTYQMKKG